VSQIIDNGFRYSNTLLMNLNNRIYLRDHQLPVYGNSGSPPSAVGARPSTMPPLEFSLPEPQLQAIINHTFPHFIISRPVDLDNGRSDDTSSLVCAVFLHTAILSDSRILTSSVSLSSDTLRNVIYFPKILSGRWACLSVLSTERTRCINYNETWV
jgi:hypothetical protein